MTETKVNDQNATEVANRIVGARIVRFSRDPSSDFSHDAQDENTIRIELDNGIKLVIGSWGHDAWGTTMHIEAPDENRLP